MASADEYAAWIVANKDKQGTPEFATVAQAYQLAKSESTKAPTEPYDPSMGGGSLSIGPWDTGIPTPQWVDRILSGAGKAFNDTGLRAKQLATFNSPEAQMAIDQAKMRDAPLMNAGMGITGNIVGNLAQIVGPSAGLGAAGLAARAPMLTRAGASLIAPKSIWGAAAQGAGMGALEPVPSGGSTTGNMMIGAAGGAAIPTAIAGGGLLKDLVAPFTKGGQQSLAARTLERFASDPNAIANANPASIVPGSIPTLAETTQDVGLAQLQRSLRNNPDANAAITGRMLANQDARLGALQGIAGDPGQREFFAASRKTSADDLYKQAFAESPQMTPWIKGQITQLQKRPAFNNAFDRAAVLAADNGIELNPQNAVQVLHWTKMALDEEISKGVRSGANISGVMDTKRKLLSVIESKDVSPPYAEARQTFAAMSRPINQMDIGQYLMNKLQPALSEFGEGGRMTPSAYANAVRNADQTARAAIPKFAGAKMENILDPAQFQTVQNIARDLGRSANAQQLGMAPGSPTAQNLVGQDILRQTLGPLGLPKGWAEATLPNQLLKATNLAYSGSQERVMGLLGKLMLDPEEAKKQLLKELDRQARANSRNQYVPYSVAPGGAGLLGSGLLAPQ